MAIFSMFGLLFFPIVLLLCAGWFFVRWQNTEDEAPSKPLEKKRFRCCLIAAGVALVVFGILKLCFPFDL